MENTGPIFEQEFEHGSTSAARRDTYRDVPGRDWRYKMLGIGGKVHRTEPSLVEKDTTAEFR
jgi:hypothetical protein